MDNNPFISRNNDLFIMAIAGATTMILTQYVLTLSVQAQFLMILTLGFLAGLFMNYLYQSLEWALFFALGVQLVALVPLILWQPISLLDIHYLIGHITTTGHYTLFLLSSWIIAIPSGYMLQRMIMGNYYRRRTLF